MHISLSRLSFLSLILLLISCTNENADQAQEVNFFPELEQKRNIFYKSGETDPFTGTSGSTYSTGSPYVQASFIKGKFHGTYSAWYDNGQKMGNSMYKNGKLHGLSEAWHRNGKKASLIEFEDGKRNGRMVIYYSSGSKNIEGYFVNGVMDSTYTRWDMQGQIEFINIYNNGELIKSDSAGSL